LFWAAAFRTGTVACRGDLGELDRCLDVVRRTATQISQPVFQWVSTFVLATRALIAGDVQAADQLTHRALQIAADADEPDADVFFGAQVTSLRWQEGTMDRSISLIDKNASSNPGMPAFNSTLACALAEGGHLDEANALLQQFSFSGFTLPLDTTWLTGMVLSAEVAILCRDKVAAGELIEKLRPWADLWSYDDITTEGPVSHYLGGLSTIIGDYDAANGYFVQSASMCARMEAKFFAARTDLSWGRLLAEVRDPSDVERAKDLFGRAYEVGAANGYGNVKRRAEIALQSLG
jgi:ATP/maltotriose-dependent transcriptional regulator MalT